MLHRLILFLVLRRRWLPQALHELPFDSSGIVFEISLFEEFGGHAHVSNEIVFALILNATGIASDAHCELIEGQLAIDQFEQHPPITALAEQNLEFLVSVCPDFISEHVCELMENPSFAVCLAQREEIVNMADGGLPLQLT